MRAAALPVLIAGTVLRATPVRSIHVQAPRPEPAPGPRTPAEEQEEPDDEFQVRLTPDEMAAASRGGLQGRSSAARCPILNLQSGATRKIYLLDTFDGLGSRILNVIGSLIYAEDNGLRFGGVVTRGFAPTSHYVNISAGMQAFFGFADASTFYVPALPSDAQSFPSLRALSEQLANGAVGDGTSVCVDFGSEMGSYQFGVVPATVMQALRSQATPLMQMPLTRFASRKGIVNVAVHVRRGDVRASTPARGTPDDYYFWLMDIVREKAPDAHFHVFSEDHTHTFNADGEETDAFEEYRKRGAYVHVNTEARETLAHMAKANVLITAKSSFSYVAAFLNPNCVLQQSWKRRLTDWVKLPKAVQKGNKEGERIAQEIHNCMNLAGAR
jgi:hypothetical protein